MTDGGLLQNALRGDFLENARAGGAVVEEHQMRGVEVEREAERVEQDVVLVGHGERSDEAVGEHIEVGVLDRVYGAQRLPRLGAEEAGLANFQRVEHFDYRLIGVDGRACRGGLQAVVQKVEVSHRVLPNETPGVLPADRTIPQLTMQEPPCMLSGCYTDGHIYETAPLSVLLLYLRREGQ